MPKNPSIPLSPAPCPACVPAAHAAIDAAPTAAPRAGAALFRIRSMDCPVEEAQIRQALEPVAGIRGLRFQLGPRTLAIDAPPAVLEQALAAIRAAGFDPQPHAVVVDPGAQPHDHDHDHDHHDHAPEPTTGPGGEGLRPLLFALALALGAEGAGFLLAPGLLRSVLEGVLALAAIGFAGLSTYRKGLVALRHGRLDINALMAVAVTGAVLIGEWPEAAMVMALYAIAELIEARSVDRARNAIQGLLSLAPEQAEVLQPDGRWALRPAAEVPLGAVVRLRPGERIALDGSVTVGTSAIDQSPVTGESIPVDKGVGDPVFAGTINQTGELQFRVTAGADDSTLARIIHAVEQAQATRAPTQRFVDRFAAVYTPAVFVFALAVAFGTPWLLGLTWLEAIYKALVLLVIACPCALVISTLVTVVSALAAAARRGILVKGGSFLEGARKLRAIALDKTGTLTEGRPRLTSHAALGEAAPDVPPDVPPDAPGWEQIAASLAARSDHPVSKAIAAGLPPPTGLAVTDFQALPGRGVQGRVDGRAFVLGNPRLIEERGQSDAALKARLATFEAAGHSVTLLAGDTGVLGLFAVADTLKASSRQAVAELKALGVVPVMLSGDNAATARAIAAQAGIDEFQGELLPQDKLAAIQALQRRHGATAMTGDGINDAPALAQADIGFAMGGAGTDIALEAADVVVMNDDLRRIPETIRLSRRTHAVLWQNIALALGIKAVFLVLALFGSATMWMAVFADLGATLLVVANGLRLLRARTTA